MSDIRQNASDSILNNITSVDQNLIMQFLDLIANHSRRSNLCVGCNTSDAALVFFDRTSPISLDENSKVNIACNAHRLSPSFREPASRSRVG
jgi:hypothetical protein